MLARHFALLLALLSPSRAQAPSPSPNGTALVGFNGTGVYSSSTTPADLPWYTYNYCNAPHASKAHWTPAGAGARLVYALTVVRHHKRTPDNLIPSERVFNPPVGWTCADIAAFNFASSPPPPISSSSSDGLALQHTLSIPANHPFASLLWNGTCDVGQLTAGGYADARKHGEDWWGVYGALVGRGRESERLWVRTSPEERTMWVARAMLEGMGVRDGVFDVHAQPATIDSLVPDYPCPAADAVRAAFQSVPAWTDHLAQFANLAARLGDILGTRGMNAWESWYDHYFDVFTSRTCGGHQLPCNATTGACVSAADAATVYALGDFEYNYIWNSAQNASTYTSLSYGVLLAELAQNLADVAAGTEPFGARLYVGHDGSMIRLASALGLGDVAPLRWPALGSEIVMEVWQEHTSERFVRVLHDGLVVPPLTRIPLANFVQRVRARVPTDVFAECMGTA
ncbi:phosphoglycerate mutase-like protein [Vararia minispora EC-137]|uniref:Phosphoglycerate mutase-like protein n=1 Tax=Vararia minispora EC-137 TaxID=1314806 RepID=A0ACB8QMP6_9AGAM|nr:phosphoglycerate mutase-like protein [Vararia minispora EC-137]